MLVQSFLEYLKYEKNYSDHTVEAYEDDLLQFKEYLGCGDGDDGNEMLLNMKGTFVRQWIVFLMDHDYSSLSVNRKLSSLRSFYRYLCKNNYLDMSPMKKIVGPKANKALPVFVKEVTMDRLFDELGLDASFEGIRDKAILDVFYTTGIRCAELVGLKDSDIDWSANLIRVTGKRNKQRLVPFAETLRGSMSVYLAERKSSVENKFDDSFFVRPNGMPLSNTIVYNIVRRRLGEASSLSKSSPHVLRHTFATSMMNNGADLMAVKELLGHASLSSTEVYTHTTFEELKKMYHQAHPRA